MQAEYVLPGRLVRLRTTVESDIDDYVRWNVPGLIAWQFDGPWYGWRIDKVIENRRKWLAGERLTPHRHLEIEAADHGHAGWVNAYVHAHDPHMTEAGIDIADDGLWNRGLGTEAFGLWVDYLFTAFDLTRLGFSTWSGNPGMVRVGRSSGSLLRGESVAAARWAADSSTGSRWGCCATNGRRGGKSFQIVDSGF